MTNDQESHINVLEWIRERLGAIDGDDCEQYERSNAVLRELAALNLSVMDVLHVLRTATEISGLYDGGCPIVRGVDLDEHVLSVVVAPPSAKNRVRVVKVWAGD